jgi:hypothetical protein
MAVNLSQKNYKSPCCKHQETPACAGVTWSWPILFLKLTAMVFSPTGSKCLSLSDKTQYFFKRVHKAMALGGLLVKKNQQGGEVQKQARRLAGCTPTSNEPPASSQE